jgi:ABC-type Na+ transport system ATPase subunit NatA
VSALASYSKKISLKEGERIALVNRHDLLSKKIVELSDRQKIVEKGQLLIQTAVNNTQNQLCFNLEALVNKALESMFPGEYTLRLDFLPTRMSTEADIYLIKNGHRVDPMDSDGGGVLDVVCFALRAVAWSISDCDDCIIMDEPFKWLSVDLRPLAANLLKQISEELGLQIIFVTHDPELVAVCDRVFEVTQDDGEVSQVQIIKGY